MLSPDASPSDATVATLSSQGGEWRALRRVVWGLAAALLAGCTPDTSPPCPAVEATFVIRVDTEDGAALPPGATLQLVYGGSETVTYDMKTGSSDRQLLCCTPTDATADSTAANAAPPCSSTVNTDAASRADAAAAKALLCEAFTHGAADALVTADGYVPLEQTLRAQLAHQPQLRRCATLDTVDIHLTLAPPDGGLTTDRGGSASPTG